jgi:hypothetical protein
MMGGTLRIAGAFRAYRLMPKAMTGQRLESKKAPDRNSWASCLFVVGRAGCELAISLADSPARFD